MKYAMDYTSKYDIQWLDYYSAGQIKKLVGVSLETLILRKQQYKAEMILWKQKLSSLLMIVMNSLL
jgi:hypothetical protein